MTTVNQKPIYLDSAATTKLDQHVAQHMSDILFSDTLFGNPSSSTHAYGWDAQDLINSARENVAELLSGKPREIIFTSGATEANNIVLSSIASIAEYKTIHIISSEIEHKSVLDTCKELTSKYTNLELTLLKPNKEGLITPSMVSEAIKENTQLVSLMHVNNEIGNITDIETIGDLCRDNGLLFHVDASQSLGKLNIDVKKVHIDFLTFSSHKLYGPKGVGGLWRANYSKMLLKPLQFGGSQERSLRPGTLPTHQISGFGLACKIAKEVMTERLSLMDTLRSEFIKKLESLNVDFTINSNLKESYSGIINLTFNKTDGNAMLMSIDCIAASTGSACNSQSQLGSYVLESLGVSQSTDKAHIRFSFSKDTEISDVLFAANEIAFYLKNSK